MLEIEQWMVALLSGAVGALLSQLLAIGHARKLEAERQSLDERLESARQDLVRQLQAERHSFEIGQLKLGVLRKFAGNRAALTRVGVDAQRIAFFEALNEIIVAFSNSVDVVAAVDALHDAINTLNQNDRLVKLFKAMCRDTGVDITNLSDERFLRPFHLVVER
jgi:hypothetical protein